MIEIEYLSILICVSLNTIVSEAANDYSGTGQWLHTLYDKGGTELAKEIKL